MPDGSGTNPKQSNWLDNDRVPAELKLMILEYITCPVELARLARAYPEWVQKLWNRYPETLFPPALENTFAYMDAALIPDLLCLYHVRRIRREYIVARRSSVETQTHRDGLQAALRGILRDGNQVDTPELEKKLETIFHIGEIIWDVSWLTRRYSNDAWTRIHDVVRGADQQHNISEKLTIPPRIRLSPDERFKFDRAFLRVDIYLLTKFWTNRQGQRHMLDMGQDINPYIPHTLNRSLRREFDSCLRFMFHALRGFLKKMARQIGAPELPTRDDLQWVPAESEERDYRYKDDGTLVPQGSPELAFAQRSVSEEQRFLLWLCEFGIECVRRAHRNDDGWRRDQLLLNFGRRHIWDTVELRHRASRYDVHPDGEMSSWTLLNLHRNRHPVKSLYGSGAAQGYTETSSPWAWATAFLEWIPNSQTLGLHGSVHRDGLNLSLYGRWLMWCDTDNELHYNMPFRRKGAGLRHGVPRGHQYMLDPEIYELCPRHPLDPQGIYT